MSSKGRGSLERAGVMYGGGPADRPPVGRAPKGTVLDGRDIHDLVRCGVSEGTSIYLRKPSVRYILAIKCTWVFECVAFRGT